jgi:hypothetical protein
MASTIGFAAFPGCEITPFGDLLEALPARERRLFHGDEDTLKKDVAESIHAIESV